MRVKQFILVLMSGLILASFQSAYGQVTITKADMPVAGGNYIYTTSNDSIDVTHTGAGVTWDFSKITPVSQDTYKYVSPAKASILYTLLFNGDVGLDENAAGIASGDEFFKTSANEYTMEGLGFSIPMIPIPIPISYSPVDVVYRFPLEYGDKDTASFAGSQTYSSYTISVHGKRFNEVDGWGKVITPYKTYNCIRVKSIVNEIDSVVVGGINRDRVEYKWLSPGEKIPIFEAIVTKSPIGNISGMTLYYQDSFKHIVNPNGPVVDFSIADTNVLTLDTVPVINSTKGAVTYSWVITPSSYTYANGTSNTSKNPDLVFKSPGLYTVSLNATGIGGSNYLTKTDYVNVTHNSGIEPFGNSIGALKLYPNPTSDNITVVSEADLLGKPWTVSIVNTDGQTIYNKSFIHDNGLIQINLKTYPQGLYLIRLTTDTKVFEGKIMKQ